MDAILLTVTGISLALAAAMGVLLARMLREERRRSDARVALLTELAVPARRDALDEFELHPDDRLELHGENRQINGVQDLFHEQSEPSPWPTRFAVVGSIAAVVAVVAFGWSNLGGGEEPAAVAQTAPAATAEAPLELLSLRHTQEQGTLTITGLVQNPRGGRVLSGVKATLFVFGSGGSFLTSGRAPLDFTALNPGEESPFVIRVQVPEDVARYRVGFRGSDDRVLAHVDRRSAEAIAQK